MKYFFLLLCSLASLVQAQDVFPPETPGVDSLVSTFRDDLKSKIQQMTANFANSELTENYTIFRAISPIKCNDGTPLPTRAQVARIDKTSGLTTEKKTEQLIETLKYTDCTGQVVFSENFVTTGSDLSPLNWFHVLTGQISYSLHPNELSKLARILDEEGREIFSVSSRREDTRTFIEFKLNSRPFLTIINVQDSGATLLSYKIQNEIVDSQFTILATQKGNLFYRENGKRPEAPSEWLQNFSNATTIPGRGGALANMQTIMDGYLNEFPPTVLVSSAGQNKRILAELNLALIQLNAGGAQLTQVKLLIQQYIEAITNGQLDLIDNRPKP